MKLIEKKKGKLAARIAAALLLSSLILVFLVLPLLNLLRESLRFTPFYQGFLEVLSGKTVKKALQNSFAISLLSAAAAVACAFFYAYIVEYKLYGKIKKLFYFISIMPMLVPSITHGLVIVYLFGKMGIVTRLLGWQLPIYGPLGIVMGSFFYAFPTAFLVLSQGFASLDGRLFENAVVLGTRPVRRMLQIVLPIMKYSVFSAFAVCFTKVFTDYGIPLSVGGTYPILPLLFYKNVIGMLDFSKGAIFSALILVPAAGVYLLDILIFSKRQSASNRNIIPVNSGRFHPLQQAAYFIISFVLVVPILLIVAAPFIRAWPYDLGITLKHFRKVAESGNLLRLAGQSVWIALCTSAAGTVLAFIAGYYYVRNNQEKLAVRKTIHGLYMVSLAVPGLALGLAYALFFRGTSLYNTFILVVLVNVMHFFGSPYLMVVSHFKLLNPNLEAVCRSLGGRAHNVLFDVIIPNSKKMLLDVFVYFFTNTMVTISAVSLLYSAKTKTLAIQITSFNDQGMWESAIVVSLVILLVNTAVRLTQYIKN